MPNEIEPLKHGGKFHAAPCILHGLRESAVDVKHNQLHAISSARTPLGVRCPLTWTLHCDFRFGEAELLVERSNARRDRAQDPSDSPVVAHGRFNQRAAYALSAMLLGHDEHRNVSVRDTVAKSAQEA